MAGLQGRCRTVVGCALACVTLLAGPSRADERDEEIEMLKKQVAELQRSDAEKQRKLDEMMEMLRRIVPQAADAEPTAERKTVAAPARPAHAEAAPPPAPAAARTGVAAAPDTEAQDSRRALDEAVRELDPDGAATPPASAGDAAATPAGQPGTEGAAGWLGTPGAASVPGTLLARPLPGQATLRLLEPSLDLLLAAGWSTADDEELETLEGGAHDPNRRGFTLQQAELSLYGAVDPYFNAEAHIVFFPDGVELEEAFGTTQRLPWGLQLKTGYYLTEFGRINPVHVHAWSWLDQPIINTRMFGGDGLRSTGAQLSWLLPLPVFSELYAGVQNANEGEFTTSFLADEGIGGYPAVRTDTRNLGDLLYLARSATAWNMGDTMSALLGFSGLFGPNSTGGPARTFIYGADFTFKWRPVDNFRGWPFVLWQSEVMKRDYTAEPFVAGTAIDDARARDDDGPGHGHGLATVSNDAHEGEGDDEEMEEDIPGALLRDWGFYTQLLYGFRHPWAAGVRFEWASGSGQSVGGRANDPLRDDRFRFSPLLQYQPTEFSRLRLQYNYDHATALPGSDAHTVWLGLELLYGTHPAHRW